VGLLDSSVDVSFRLHDIYIYIYMPRTASERIKEHPVRTREERVSASGASGAQAAHAAADVTDGPCVAAGVGSASVFWWRYIWVAVDIRPRGFFAESDRSSFSLR